MKRSSWLLAVVASGFIASLAIPHKAAADLDEKYLRNGECYMLIGETKALRGIYRMNNPVKGIYSLNKLVIDGNRFNNSFSLAVDLYRNIYTFTEDVDPDFKVKPGNIYRQVLTGVTNDQADIGTGNYHHHDSRSAAQRNRNIYRSISNGAASRQPRKIYGSSCHSYCPNRKWGSGCTYIILNPGSQVTPPAGYTLPNIKTPGHKLYLGYYDKPWFSIPNGTWFASWHKSGSGYLNYVDTEQIKEHHYKKWTWENTAGGDEVNYPNAAKGKEVAASAETITTRESVNGCLDSCGADSSQGFAPAKPMSVDIAMQPPLLGGGGDRVYSLAREQGNINPEIKLSEGGAAAKKYTKGWIRGTPDNANSNWIGISLKNANQDYVYIMGSDTIKTWYTYCWPGESTSKMDIRAVGVSNQWHQKGGIVYAYDKYYNSIYKFDCVDAGNSVTQANPGISKGSCETISVKDIINSMGGDGNYCEVDDIKADGFGSVFIGVSFPSTNKSTYNPAKHFKATDAIHMCYKTEDESGNVTVNIIFRQEYAKVVFERNVSDGKIREVGRTVYAWDYYSIQPQVSPQCYAELCTLSWPKPENEPKTKTKKEHSDGKWATIIKKYHPNYVWQDHLNSTNGNCTHKSYYKNLDTGNPGHCKLAVINVPTPPRVYALSGYDSFLDIIGPYDSYVSYNTNDQSTQQGDHLLNRNTELELNTVYYYMVENYPIPGITSGQNPKEQPDWDKYSGTEENRHGGFITSIMDRYPYRPSGTAEPHTNGVRYDWKTWMVMDLYGNCVCEKVQENDMYKDGNYYNYIYSPVFGKFIMTCRVQYDWYNYDKIPFGGNIDDMAGNKYPGVKNYNKWAYPLKSKSGAYEFQSASSRLSEIMNSFTFKGKKFMLEPFDQNGEVLKGDKKPDYSKIISGDENCQYLALEPITVGKGPDPSPVPVYQIAAIERCDDITGWNKSNYIYNASYWKGVDKNLGYFGIKAGEVYNWRINVASQANMIDLTYLRNEMKNNTKSPFYVNKKSDFKFQDDGTDLRWADKQVWVSASLVYEVPKEGGGSKKISLALKTDNDTSGSAGSDYEFPYPVNDNVKDSKNLVFYTTSGELPPTDPTYATIRINMRRQYSYDMWAYDKSNRPMFLVKNLPGWLQVTGEAKILIVDGVNSKVAWDKTSPNNLFGITGRKLETGVGPGPGDDKKNPKYVKFTVTDNNPWDALKISPKGITLNQHVANYAYNYGSKVDAYCKGNPALAALNPVTGYDVEGQISNAKKNHQPSANLNYKPLFSRAARDVRISFETTRRTNDSADETVNGRVTLGRGDKLYVDGSKKDISGRNFDDNTSTYSHHYHNKADGTVLFQKNLEFIDSTFVEVIGNTNYYSATNNYQFNVPNLPVGTKDNGKGSSPRYTSNNIVPDGYANNSPNYRPYKFFISYTDSSGNYVRDKEFNVVLHVIDDIPPIGYGSLQNYKDESLCFFPSKVLGSSQDVNNPINAPSYYLSGENYFGDVNNPLLRVDWNCNSSQCQNDGYVNKVTTGDVRYRTLKSLGDNITTKFNDAVLKKQIENGVGPKYMEDNVECDFKVYVSDNCGTASAKLTLKYLDSVGNTEIGNIESKWESATSVDGKTTSIVNQNDEVYHTIFRGNSDQFPMAIPITIVATDNAKSWDYWTGNGKSGEWVWTSKVPGKAKENKRTFKTTVPVYDSSLDIRILDKTIKNQKNK